MNKRDKGERRNGVYLSLEEAAAGVGFILKDEEISWSGKQGALPFLLPESYASLIDPDDKKDPIRRQAIPSAKEFNPAEYEREDPLGESAFTVLPFLIHRYRSRALFLATGRCAMYCRHCFRRNFTGTDEEPEMDDVCRAAGYISGHPEIKELLISGGDPLTLPAKQLLEILTIFREVNSDLVIRLCTRVPVTAPDLVTQELISGITGFRSPGLFMMTQINHPRELSPKVRACIANFIDSGIPVFNQAVLLKGVNDSAELLIELMHNLLKNRIKPYYLFHLDMAAGTDHFRISLKRGLELYRELENNLSNLALPAYGVDIPGGGGKVNLTEGGIVERNGEFYSLRNREGEVFPYLDPAE